MFRHNALVFRTVLTQRDLPRALPSASDLLGALSGAVQSRFAANRCHGFKDPREIQPRRDFPGYD